jgi:hypothetical protein
VALELLFPTFNDLEALSATILNLSARVPVSERARLVLELPYATAKVDLGFFGDLSENGIGNPYAGVELGAPDARLFTQIGARLPVTSLETVAPAAGLLADFDRAEAFLPDIFAVTAALNYRVKSVSGLVVHLRAEPALLVPKGDAAEEGDPEILLGYAGFLGFSAAGLSVMGGITGRAILTENSLDLEERSLNQLSLNAGVWFGNVRPAIQLRFPLDSDLKDVLSSVLGLTLAVRW